MTRLLILRPEPGASATRHRAEAAGWETIVAPLFAIEPRDWTPPDPAGFDAVMMTSANAARHGGAGLSRFTGLLLYAVGEATTTAARNRGFADIVTGDAGIERLAGQIRADGHARILHLAGKKTRRFDTSRLQVTTVAVYAAEPREPVGLADVLQDEIVALLHSPRAARYFAEYCDSHDIDRQGIGIVSISPPALNEAGGGWRGAVLAESPTDAAMLEAAARLPL